MKIRIALYAIFSVVALVLTWTNNIQFIQANPGAGLGAFVEATHANDAASSISWDLTLLLASCFTFMVVESRRLKIRFVWIYMVLSMLIAIAVMFPLFMIARELKLGDGEPAAPQPA